MIENKTEDKAWKNQNPHHHFEGHHYYGPEEITRKETDEFLSDYLPKFFFQCDKLGEFMDEGCSHWKPTIGQVLRHMYDHYPEQKQRAELCDILQEVEESFGTETTKEMLNDCMKVSLGDPD